MLTLQVSSHAIDPKKYSVQESFFFEYLKKIEQLHLSTYPQQQAEVYLILVDDAYIRSLNKTYRNKDTSTDVLSFFLFDASISSTQIPSPFGEIYVSLETAQKQAKAYGHTLQDEMNILFVHGLLHLLGFDHDSPKDAQKMESLEKQILKS